MPETLPKTIPKTIFVLGDSISIRYGPFLQKSLGEGYVYNRKGGVPGQPDPLNEEVINGQDSNVVLDYLLKCQKAGVQKFDLLMLNCGLHDVKRSHETGQLQIPLDRYHENLQRIIEVGRALAGQVVWVRTTLLNKEHAEDKAKSFDRMENDITACNATADEVMRSANVPTIDLTAFTASLDNPPGSIYTDHVHFNEQTAQKQGKFVADRIRGLKSAAVI